MIYLYLIKEFIIIGCLAFGGGMVVVPFIQNIAQTTGMITETQIVEMIAISEITPGPLAVNMATYVGYIMQGIPGGIITTMALILPQFFIVFGIYKIFSKFKDNKNVIFILKGIKPVSLALTAGAALSILKTSFLVSTEKINNIFSIFNWKCIILGIVVLVSMRKIKLHPIFYFIICAGIGVIFSF